MSNPECRIVVSPMQLPDNWQVFASAAEVADYTVSRIIQLSKQAIRDRGEFHLVTAGGTTPLQVYRQLADCHTDSSINWRRWHIYMGDERCLPAEDAERNSLALQQAWLDHSPIPTANRHFIPAELGAMEAVRRYVPVVSGQIFDLVLLGMGEDGHTASLFPGHEHAEESYQLVQTEFDSPKPPAERVTLSQACLSNSEHVLKIITGCNKRDAIQLWLSGEELPISLVHGRQTEVVLSQDSLPI